jgi:hypothetical protein
MIKYSNEVRQGFGAVENWETSIPVDTKQPFGHKVLTEKFIQSIMSGGDELIAYGWEGLNPVMLANGIMLSSFEKRAVEFPVDGDAFENKLKDLIASSKFNKNVSDVREVDFEKSFSKQ